MENDPRKRVRNRAYELWQAAGKPAGDGAEYWLQAEAEAAQLDPVVDAETPDADARPNVERDRPENEAQIARTERKARF